MKKLYYAALAYMVAGLAAGYFVRLYVESRQFEGETMLGLLHFHLLVLGMMMFMLLLGLEKALSLSRFKSFRLFYWHYNAGLVVTCGMMLVHGVMQVNDQTAGGMIAGIAGLGHILLAAALGMLFVAIGKAIDHPAKNH